MLEEGCQYQGWFYDVLGSVKVKGGSSSEMCL